MTIDQQLMDILRCPLSKAPLREVDGWLVSTDPETRRRYPVRDGIPVMLESEAETMDEAAWRTAVGSDA